MILKKELGKKLAMERIGRGLELAHIAKQMGTQIRKIEYAELGHKDITWKKYEKLLQFYRKKIKIELVDEQE